MKKESIVSTVFLIIVLAVAIIMGLTVVSDAFQHMYDDEFKMSPVLFTLLVLFIGFVVNVCLTEVAHIVGAKIGKCKIVSVNLYFFCFKKTKEGKKFAFEDFDGLTGETKITTTEKSKLNAYVWMPIVVYAFELALCIVLYTMGQTAARGTALRWVGIAALLWIILSSILFLYDFIPVRLDTMNDGYRLSLLTKPENAKALLRYMNYQGEISYNEQPKELEFFEEITDFTAGINLEAIEQQILLKNNQKAREMLDKLLASKDKIDPFIVKQVVAQDLFVKLMEEPLEDVKKYYEESVGNDARKFISNDGNISSLRVYSLIAGLIDNSRFEVQYALSKREKAYKRCPKHHLEAEKQLFQEVIEKIKSAHPDWKENE